MTCVPIAAKGYGLCLWRLRMIVMVSLICTMLMDTAVNAGCKPTPHDEIGPFYRPNAPLRDKIGDGYLLFGVVRDAVTCKPIPDARIEIWQAGPHGEYGDQWRATVISDSRGRYRIETSFPPPYARRPPHIHLLVDARNYAGLITQHYPVAGQKKAHLDLVIEREH